MKFAILFLRVQFRNVKYLHLQWISITLFILLKLKSITQLAIFPFPQSLETHCSVSYSIVSSSGSSMLYLVC